jgi:hypothetical protein
MDFVEKQTEIELLNEKILFEQHSLLEINQKKQILEEAKSVPSKFMFSGGIFIKTDTKSKLEQEQCKLEKKETCIKNEIPIQIERLKKLQAEIDGYWK